MVNEERLLERFLRYVRVDTTAREGQAGYPSSPGQLELLLAWRRFRRRATRLRAASGVLPAVLLFATVLPAGTLPLRLLGRRRPAADAAQSLGSVITEQANGAFPRRPR